MAIEAATTGGGAPKIGDNQVASSYSPPAPYTVLEDEIMNYDYEQMLQNPLIINGLFYVVNKSE